MSVVGLLDQDRFVAFSFAAADVLLEVGPTDVILHVSGSPRGVTGRDGADLVGQPCEALFTDRAAVRARLAALAEGGRLEPFEVKLAEAFGGRAMVLGGCRLPGSIRQYYLTISSPQAAPASGAAGRDDATGLLDAARFQQHAGEVLRHSAEDGRDLRLTLLRLPHFQAFSLQAGTAACDHFLAGVGALLRACSLDGRTAGRLGEDSYGVVLGAGFDASLLDARLAGLARGAAPGAAAPGCERCGVELARGALSQEEAAKALAFTLSSFGQAGDRFAIASLTQAFDQLLARTIAKFTEYKGVVAESRFALAFQPIVDLERGTVRHYEVLSRLEGGKSPHRMVTFAEELGVIEQFDLVVCRRALDALRDGGLAGAARLAVNLSAKSMESRLFLDALLSLLEASGVEDRLLFEITESMQVADLAGMNAAIQRLRQRGFRVGLDDFAADAAAFSYLQALAVDFVKIDGASLRAALADQRGAMMLKAMCGLCRDLAIATVAEMIETAEQAEKLGTLGVECGQGYLFGKPAALPTAPATNLHGDHAARLAGRRVAG
jgi:EAL domain-containing protein (putative c-di-GMP-specific phosphodiesterase class I)